MGWFDKKVEIEIRDDDGRPKKVKVSQKEFDRWVAEGKVEILGPAYTAYILSPMGNRQERWVVGTQVPRDVYDRLKDTAGNLYVLEVYQAGKPEQHCLPKDKWVQAKAAMDAA